jgi:hypothetical protein
MGYSNIPPVGVLGRRPETCGLLVSDSRQSRRFGYFGCAMLDWIDRDVRVRTTIEAYVPAGRTVLRW